MSSLPVRYITCHMCGVTKPYTDRVLNGSRGPVVELALTQVIADGWKAAHWSMALCPDCVRLGVNPWRRPGPPDDPYTEPPVDYRLGPGRR